MKTKIILIILAIASTALSAGGIALARNAALRRAVVISLPLAFAILAIPYSPSLFVGKKNTVIGEFLPFSEKK